MADGVPTYVVHNDSNGKEDVFHRGCLLLWIAADADKDDGVRSNSAITVQVANGLGGWGYNGCEGGVTGWRLRTELGHVQDDDRSPPPNDRPEG